MPVSVLQHSRWRAAYSSISTAVALITSSTSANLIRPGDDARQFAAPQAAAHRAVSSGDRPREIVMANPATVASPLPTPERPLILSGRAQKTRSFGPAHHSKPSLPKLGATVPAPRSKNCLIALRASAAPVIASPVNCSASSRLGLTKSGPLPSAASNAGPLVSRKVRHPHRGRRKSARRRIPARHPEAGSLRKSRSYLRSLVRRRARSLSEKESVQKEKRCRQVQESLSPHRRRQ
jgi:hypothetical protein